jgi:hypothetical protein
LNLGQNDISGEIPLGIGGSQDDGCTPLTNIREFIRMLDTTPNFLFRYGDIDESLRERFKDIKHSRDLFWLHPQQTYWNPINLREFIDEYIKAEEKYLLTKIFQNVRKMDPVRLIERLNSASIHSTLLDNIPIE